MNLNGTLLTASLAHTSFEKAVGTSYSSVFFTIVQNNAISAIINFGCSCPFWEVIFHC